MINDHIKHLFLINLKRRPERLAAAMAQIDSQCIEKVTHTPAIDGQTLEMPEHESLDGGPVSMGDLGCTLSHLAILRFARATGMASYGAFEDDIEFHPNFNARFDEFWNAVPADWDMVYMGANHSGGWTKVNDHIVRMHKSYTTHAIIINHTAYDKLIEIWGAANEKVDVGISLLHKTMNCYAFYPNMVYQADGYSDILEKETSGMYLRKTIAPNLGADYKGEQT